ncbi:MAG TPA: hypothetical protein VM940_00455 [Chthoniobacterales bacterium]|nr:hypothetical protein [Chthoniobacterales bacterium]
MKRPQVKRGTRKQQPLQMKEPHFLMGVHCGANVSMHLLKSGWTDLDKLEAEVVSRVTGRPRCR